jgi:hypothetical protein
MVEVQHAAEPLSAAYCPIGLGPSYPVSLPTIPYTTSEPTSATASAFRDPFGAASHFGETYQLIRTKPVKPISNDAPEPHTLQATALVNEAYLKMAAIGGSEVRVRRWLAGGEEP